MSDSTAGLAAPGSSSYNSATMSVGDGTWDSTTNTFLLPNLQGLNFATMQYNGMGARFSTLSGYHNLIRAHGVIAAIVFLFIVPFAIMINRFYGKNPWFALKVHIWCQILTVLLTTVVFILGNIAVGPERALSNPHHVVGLTIYVLVLFQFFSGWLTHRGEKSRKKSYAPVKAVLHMWFGRITSLLGLAQIPLGLTLYGSPAWLFIMYSLITFALIVIYFVLSYIQERNRGLDYESELSFEEKETRKSGRFGKYATVAAAGVGISALTNRLRQRREAVSRHSGSEISEEYSQYGHRQEREKGFTKKSILGLGALGTASYWLGGRLGKRKNKRDRDDVTEFTESVEDSVEAAEEGRHGASPGPSPAPHHALNPRPVGHRRADSEMSESTWEEDDTPTRRRSSGHGLRNAALGIGTFAFARNYFKNRRQKKEDARIEEIKRQELEDERIQRANSRKYTGDGLSRPGAMSVTSTNLTPIAGPTSAGALGGGQPSLRPVHPSGQAEDPFVNSLAPPPPPHSVGMSSQSYESVGRVHHRGHGEALAAGAAGAAIGAGMAAGASDHRDRSSSRRRTSGGTVNSPPVSVKLNMHSDGRHVTLRRLTEEEAAAERARHSRDRARRRRAGSASSLSGTEAATGYPTDHYRRTPSAHAAQQQAAYAQNNPQGMGGVQYAPTASGVHMPIPPPPPIPYTEPRPPTEPRPTPPHLQSSVGSPPPGTFEDSVTGGSTNYEESRRRRRAQRAAAGMEKAARANRGEFN